MSNIETTDTYLIIFRDPTSYVIEYIDYKAITGVRKMVHLGYSLFLIPD